MLTSPRNNKANEGIYLATLFAVLIGTSTWWSYKLDQKSESVVHRSDAGQTISATYSESSFGAYVTRIETTKSTFKVQGTLAINEGERLTLEQRGNGDKKLCKANTKDCRTLAE